MYYATIDNKIGQSESLPTNAIEITAEQYKSLLSDKMCGKHVTVENGQVTSYMECYSTTGEVLKERDLEQPLITIAPPEGLHKPKWTKGKWVDAETPAEKAEREDEAVKIKELNRIQEIKTKANELILARYSIIWQLNHPRVDIQYKSDYDFIDNIRRISNEAEANGTALEDINWEVTNG